MSALRALSISTRDFFRVHLDHDYSDKLSPLNASIKPLSRVKPELRKSFSNYDISNITEPFNPKTGLATGSSFTQKQTILKKKDNIDFFLRFEDEVDEILYRKSSKGLFNLWTFWPVVMACLAFSAVRQHSKVVIVDPYCTMALSTFTIYIFFYSYTRSRRSSILTRPL